MGSGLDIRHLKISSLIENHFRIYSNVSLFLMTILFNTDLRPFMFNLCKEIV